MTVKNPVTSKNITKQYLNPSIRDQDCVSEVLWTVDQLVKARSDAQKGTLDAW